MPESFPDNYSSDDETTEKKKDERSLNNPK
jgi:hypothetical protein